MSEFNSNPPGKGTLSLKGVVPKTKVETKQRIIAGRYLLKGVPRPGGHASVFRSLDSESERPVAVKLFRSQYETDEIVEESFKRETKALSHLKHPNIVEILDSGIDPESGEHYIVMEWIGRDLEQILKTPTFTDWATFFSHIGRPVLEALAFAHTHATIHRDIKPSNVLLTDDGIPKICDFGISKIRNFLEPGVTLSQFATIPFAPPEPDDGSYTYSRDVFGFAALCVAALSRAIPRDYASLHSALGTLDLSDPIKTLLRRCLSVESPSDRPVSAPALLSAFDQLAPRKRVERKHTVLMALTNKVKDILNVDLGISEESALRSFVTQDLSDARVSSEAGSRNPAATTNPALRLLGDRYGYISIVAPENPDRLLLISALELPTAQLEERRDEALAPQCQFAFTGVPAASSRLSIQSLADDLAKFSADQKVALVEKRAQAIFNTWLNLLNAKTELERKRKRSFPYEDVEQSGAVVRFHIPDGLDTKLLEDEDVQIEIDGERTFLGTTVSVRDNLVVVLPSEANDVDVDDLPDTGSIDIDTTKADASLDKQKTALDAVRYARSVNTRLGSYITSPESTPECQVAEVEFIQQDIDDDKKAAIRVAMGQPELLLVQGPPGTGKTTFITEVVLQHLQRDPECRILLSSQTHVALDNSLERITTKSNFPVTALRIGHEDDERISESTRPLLLDLRLPALKKTAIAKGRQFLQTWAESHGVEMKLAKMAMALERSARLKERLESIERGIAEIRPNLTEDSRKNLEPEQRSDLDQDLRDRMQEREVLTRELKDAHEELAKYESDKETLAHFRECSASELRSWANDYAPSSTLDFAKLKKLLAAHSDWEIRFGRTREFRAAVVASSQVVAGTCIGVMGVPGRQEIQYDLCIVDEASIATPTEVLVPMSRARRSIIVGDSRQLSPFQDPELESSGLLSKFLLNREDQRHTLFNHLSGSLPTGLIQSLTTQHRMVPAIGNLISSCFYEGSLISVGRQNATGLERTLARPVVWFSTCKLANKGSRRVGTSYTNDGEVDQIVRLLRRANLELTSKSTKKMSVAVLTGYGVQKERLKTAIDLARRDLNAFSDFFVNVVDAFQGREADIAIFSVTRSDDRGLGFLREMERINVALSRGRNFLVVVGDHLFCQEAEGRSNPLKSVLEYMRLHPNDCLIKDIEP